MSEDHYARTIADATAALRELGAEIAALRARLAKVEKAERALHLHASANAAGKAAKEVSRRMNRSV